MIRGYSLVLELTFQAHKAVGAVLCMSVGLSDAFFTCVTAKLGTVASSPGTAVN